MNREQFTFYRGFLAGISRIKNKSARCDAYDAIVRYALDGEEPDLDKLPDAAALAFVMARPNLDASRRKAEAGRKGGNGSLTNEDKQTESKDEANGKQTESKPQARGNRNQEKEQEKEQDKDKDKEQMLIAPLSPPTGGTRRFVPPTVEEVQAYCAERGNMVNPNAFVDFYAAKGWKVGSNPMKDWKAAVRTWEQRDNRGPGTQGKEAEQETSNPYLRALKNIREGNT